MFRGITTWSIVIGFASLTYIAYYKNPTLFKNTIRGSRRLRKYSTAMKMNEMNSLIPDNYSYNGLPCNSSLDLPQDEILEKVSSYKFPGIDHYIADLFPESDDHILPQHPIFVTALSSNHSEEGLAMIHNFEKMINKNKTYKLIVFDIGLTNAKTKQLKDECACEVRRFPFHKFPDHVRIIRAYAWKPLIIQLVAKTHPFVVWLDASIRFFTTDIDELVQRAKHYGILATKGGKTLVRHTSKDMFRYLNEPPCLYLSSSQTLGGLVFLYQTPFIKKYFMVPWVSCSLARGCMVPYKDVFAIQKCDKNRKHLFSCHRFDQSVLGILVNRLFHKTITNHYIKQGKYYGICRNCKRME